MNKYSVCEDVRVTSFTNSVKEMARNPIKRTTPCKCLKEKSSDKIKDMGENGVPSSNVYPDLPTSDESDDDIEDHIEENTQLKSDNEQKIETPSKEKVIQSSLSEINIRFFGYLAIFLVAIIAIAFGTRYYLFPVASDSNVTEPLTANKVVKALQQKFSGQSDLSLKIIKTSIKKIINSTDPEPTEPSILLLMSSKGADETGSRFARELAYLISLNQTNYLAIDGHDLKDTNPDDANKLIDDKIKSTCAKQIPAVVLLEDLDMLPASSVKILFSYCDHENAPFKRAVFIMTISTREVIPKSADSKMLDGIAETHLRQSWNMTDDMSSPLLSRITVSVVGIFADKLSK